MSDNTGKPPKPTYLGPDFGEGEWRHKFTVERPDEPFSSGFLTHDQCVGYFRRGGLYLFGARPGVGKTSMLLSMASNMTQAGGIRVYYCNLEMPVLDMWERLYCLNTKIPLKLLDFPDRVTKDQAIGAIPWLRSASPLWLENNDFATFVRTSTETIQPGSRSVIFVDYLGLFSMRGYGSGDHYALISEVAKGLKMLARNLQIPLIAAAQLNRDVEKRKESGLTLADLRGSGELENHADAVFGLTRENAERLDVTTLKNRRGPLTDYNLHYDAPRCAVEEWDD